MLALRLTYPKNCKFIIAWEKTIHQPVKQLGHVCVQVVRCPIHFYSCRTYINYFSTFYNFFTTFKINNCTIMRVNVFPLLIKSGQ